MGDVRSMKGDDEDEFVGGGGGCDVVRARALEGDAIGDWREWMGRIGKSNEYRIDIIYQYYCSVSYTTLLRSVSVGVCESRHVPVHV